MFRTELHSKKGGGTDSSSSSGDFRGSHLWNPPKAPPVISFNTWKLHSLNKMYFHSLSSLSLHWSTRTKWVWKVSERFAWWLAEVCVLWMKPLLHAPSEIGDKGHLGELWGSEGGNWRFIKVLKFSLLSFLVLCFFVILISRCSRIWEVTTGDFEFQKILTWP